MKFQAIVLMFRLACIIWTALIVGGASQHLMAQAPQPIDRLLVFKGTHNSYVCRTDCLFSCTADPPIMNHPSQVQIDDFGVWALELDFSIRIENGQPRAVVGHDGPDDEVTCWGRHLTDFLFMIRDAAAIKMAYRPVFIYFEKKDNWGEESYKDPNQYLPILENDLKVVFGEEQISGPRALMTFYHQYNRYPTVPEIPGRVVPVMLSPTVSGTAFIFHDGPFSSACDGCPPGGLGPTGLPGLNLGATPFDHCTNRNVIQALIQNSDLDIFRVDQYQADWTFGYGVPPNPLVVDWTAGPSGL